MATPRKTAAKPAPQTATPEVAQAAAAEPMADFVATHYSVRALAEGYRRAGRAWSVHEEIVPGEDLTEAQRDALLADPRLVVIPLDLRIEH